MSDPMFDDLTSTEEGRRAYHSEGLIFRVTELICKIMKEKHITRKELADRAGLTKGHITQLLTGEHNMTLETAAELFYALGCKLDVEASPCTVEDFTDAVPCQPDDHWELAASIQTKEPKTPDERYHMAA